METVHAMLSILISERRTYFIKASSVTEGSLLRDNLTERQHEWLDEVG